MRVFTITEREAGLRLDKVAMRYLPNATKSFIYKMLRKKNITLNGKKAEGNERVSKDDEIKFFLSEETIEAMKGSTDSFEGKQPVVSSGGHTPFSILYEDEHVLIMNKPAGMLSQKAKREDISLIEHMTEYLFSTGSLTKESYEMFHPGVCNRLDRNTSGIILAGKTTYGLQELSELLSSRTLEKYYLTIVKGTLKTKQLLSGYLIKEGTHNKVTILTEPVEGASEIKTEYEPIASNGDATLLRIHLITGKSHQIRAHLASIGHPVIGDGKYGDPELNRRFKRKYQLQNHLLHAYEICFGQTGEHLTALEGKVIKAQPPKLFMKILKAEFPDAVI